MVEHVESTESWLELLQEHNYRLRIKLLQNMRGSTLVGSLRGALNEWKEFLQGCRAERKLVALRGQMITRFVPMLSRLLPISTEVLAKTLIHEWRSILDALREENQMLDELDLHRRGRTQLIQQYRELEGELVAERQRGQEVERRAEDAESALGQLEQELASVSARLRSQVAIGGELQAKVQVLTEQLSESQDKGAGLRREVWAQSERTRRLEQQAEQEQEERRELADGLMRAETLVEGLRAGAAHHDARVERYEAMAMEKDARILVLDSQVTEAHGCIEALSRGASEYLRGGLSMPIAAAQGLPAYDSSRSGQNSAPASVACGGAHERHQVASETRRPRA